MKVNPGEPEVTARGAAGPAPADDADARTGVRVTQEAEGEDPRHDDPIDEPGYGHGV